jgi:hypothetical protein
MPNNSQRTNPRNGKRINLKNHNPMQMQQQKQYLPVPPNRMIMMRRNLINMIS